MWSLQKKNNKKNKEMECMKESKMVKQDLFVSIIIVTYNGADCIIDCLRSLKSQNYNQKKIEIIAVDNASVDKTPEIIENTFRDVHIIRNNFNLGFGRANNIGIKKSKGNYIILLNQDSLLDKNWLSVLVKTMEQHPDAGCCGAEEYAYIEYNTLKKPEKKIKECLWMGCGSVIFRKKVLDEAGIFDPFYFMYVEDMDIVWRIKENGWKILQNYEALWFHKGKERPIEPFGKRMYWSWKNRLYLIIKFGSLAQIVKSLHYYLQLLLKNDPKMNDESKVNKVNTIQEEKLKQNKSFQIKEKIIFITKLLAVTPSVLIYGIFAGYVLRQKQKLNQQEVDGLIEYTDKIFYHRYSE